SLFSGEGLTFYGGLITSIVLILFYLRKKSTPFLAVADAAGPSLMIAYGIGRIGCQLAGDGDYGIPTEHAFGMSYPEGMVSTLSARNTELVRYFQEVFPGRPIPEDIIVHPTPVYETLIAFAFFAILWKFRTKQLGMGQLFGMYLILAGIERFFVEFLRMNPLYAGLSQAQWISIALAVSGGIIYSLKKRS
ncbi:MAG: prolipoprotein diacylglyceryl transferase, partial [Bacteroidota bacterium]